MDLDVYGTRLFPVKCHFDDFFRHSGAKDASFSRYTTGHHIRPDQYPSQIEVLSQIDVKLANLTQNLNLEWVLVWRKGKR